MVVGGDYRLQLLSADICENILLRLARAGLTTAASALFIDTINLNTSAANRLIGEVVQSRRRPLLGPSPG